MGDKIDTHAVSDIRNMGGEIDTQAFRSKSMTVWKKWVTEGECTQKVVNQTELLVIKLA